jgi:DeoR/GlpR family transcriptional regulator of sugar metabolism
MIASERMQYIMNSLNKKGIINIKAIAKEINVSEITVRRDFEKLEMKGKLKRVQGGATLTTDFEDVLVDAELTMRERISLHMEEKSIVAKRAAKCVKDGDCVFIDAGTSMVPLAEFLFNKNVKIVTYNDLVIREIKKPVATIFIIGGQFLPYYSMSVGPMAQNLLMQFHFDVAFLGCAGVNLEQAVAYTTETESLMMKHIALQNANKRYLLIDSSKLEKKGFFKITETSAFDAVFCNQCNTVTPVPDNFIYPD